MLRINKYIPVIFISFFTFISLSYGQEIKILDLINRIKQSTEVQRIEIVKQYKGKNISASGVVSDVRPYNAFEEITDKNLAYYQILTEVQDTPQGYPYQVVFFSKDKDMVDGISKGQSLDLKGSILKIFDTRLWIEIWIYTGEYGPEEERVFADYGALPVPPKVN